MLVETQESEAQFYRLDPTGAVKRIYRAQSCSIEEELHKTTYEIIGSRMVERHSLDIPFEQTKESIADELSGLSELPPGESPTFAEVKSAIATHHGSVAQVEGRRATEIAALVQVHPVASSAMRAQIPALANRIVRYQDEECERILDCVDRLHDLHVSLEDRPKTFVNRTAKLLADACALITFKVDSYTSPATPHRTAHGDTPSAVTIPLFESLQRERERVIAQASQAPFAQMIAVVDAWGRAQRGLLQAEDVQSYIDARSTALAYAKAAGLMAAAAECLALGFAGVTLLYSSNPPA
ncbi:MAG: hypothetical protein K0V04_15055 [Deltaproteobacteria bacterium]|nr:hypothetical protein [Deltaproteobacteria bacterium]